MKITLKSLTIPSQLHDSGEPLSIEEYIINCARVSSTDNRLNHETAPKLLKYLIKQKHWSPFEMVSFAFEIETSRAIGTQLLRHRSFSFQEFSQRYSNCESIEPVELREQAKTNRQSSTNQFEETTQYSKSTQRFVDEHLEHCQNLYENLIKDGVAKECARMVLPLATQTTLIMNGTLRSWIHFLEQRDSDHAQKEIRLIAVEIKNQLAIQCPWTAKALEWVYSCN